MATIAVRKLNLKVGELVEIEGKRYEVVPARGHDGLTLEPPITPMAELHEKWGTQPASKEDFDRLFGDLQGDGEG